MALREGTVQKSRVPICPFTHKSLSLSILTSVAELKDNGAMY